MALLSALRRTPSTLVRNPALFVPVLLLSVLQVPQLVLQSSAPLLASVVSLALSVVYIVATPFVQAGLIGMADEAFDGRTSLSTFVAEGKANFVQLFIVYLLLVGVNLVLAVVAVVAGVVVAITLYPGGGGQHTALLVVAGLVVAAAVLAYLLLAFFIQFYGQAIVIDDFGAFDAVTHSFSVVRSHVVSVLGYSLLVGVLAGGFGLVVGVISLLSRPPSSVGPVVDWVPITGLPSVSVAVVAVVVVVLGTLFGGFFGVLSVSYYRELAA